MNFKKEEAGILYCVAMPIGNVQDLSLRAKNVLTQVNIIAAEDTRKLKDWLKRASVQTSAKILSYHSHNEKESAKGIVQLLKNNQNVALVSDAGTPRLSDPGFSLVRLAHQENILLKPIPGPAALISLLSISPLPSEPLLFLGFLSPKTARRKNILSKYIDFKGTLALYESVHRISSLIKDIDEVFGNPVVFIGRELTKEYEEYFYGSAQKALTWLVNKKGESSILVGAGL